MSYVIACGDEGVQINEGTRLGIVGAGVKLEQASTVVTALKQLFTEPIVLATSEENDWIKQQFGVSTWEQANASFQQFGQALADKESVNYAGFLPFADPRVLEHGIKGHMVRPHGIHIANKICFTLAGGEQIFNLGQFVISAEWLSQVPLKVAEQVLKTQVDFYQSLVNQPLKMVFESEGALGAEHAQKQAEVLQKLGYLQ